ncbi:MAG: low molecular weight phosphotyrosine protein phosphatase [Bacteroidetes bacterium]|nr:low molecular weight phosphotyrosine protein phosphatase [Bacteroidota bacterium]
MLKILFVCTGNICRSPLAEGILRDKLLRANIQAIVDSCGFESFHVGDKPDSRAIAVSKKRGIDISGHRARLFRDRDFEEFDMIFVMDSTHHKNVMKRSRNSDDQLKVDYFLNVLQPGQNLDVPDPWYHDLNAFEKVYAQLDEACEAFVKRVTKTI